MSAPGLISGLEDEEMEGEREQAGTSGGAIPLVVEKKKKKERRRRRQRITRIDHRLHPDDVEGVPHRIAIPYNLDFATCEGMVFKAFVRELRDRMEDVDKKEAKEKMEDVKCVDMVVGGGWGGKRRASSEDDEETALNKKKIKNECTESDDEMAGKAGDEGRTADEIDIARGSATSSQATSMMGISGESYL